MNRILVAVLVGLAIVGVTWLWKPNQPVTANQASSATSPREPTVPSAVGNEPKSPTFAARNFQPPSLSSVPKPTVAAEYAATTLKAFFDTYVANWRTSSPEVKAYLTKALNHCAAFVGRNHVRLPLPLLPENATEKPFYKERLAALERVTIDCAGFEDYQLPAGMAEELRVGAMTGDDPVAKARRLAEMQRAGKTSEVDQLATSVIQGPLNLEVLNGLTNYYSSRYQEVRFGDPPKQPAHELYMDAWRLVMCDFGLDCAADSRDMTLLCWKHAICGVANYEEYVARRYSAEQRDELSRIRLQLLTGLERRDLASLGIPRAIK